MLIIASLFLAGLLTVCWVCFRYRCAAHPATWFAIGWLSAILAYAAMDAFGTVPPENSAMLGRLCSYLIITSLMFAVIIVAFRPPNRKIENRIQLYSSGYVVVSVGFTAACLVILSLSGSLVNWISMGANFGYDNSLRAQWLREIPRVTALTWYLYMFIFPAIVVLAWSLSESIMSNRPFGMTLKACSAGIVLSALLWTLGTGGRQSMGLALMFFIACLFVFIARDSLRGLKPSVSKVRTYSAVAVVMIVAFGSFISYSGRQRAEGSRQQYVSAFSDVPILRAFDQPIEYNGHTIATYQTYGSPARRVISETGPVTFAGIFLFGSRSLLGWRPITAFDTNPERGLASTGFKYAYGTRNIFYDLEADFGFEKSLIAVLIVVIAGHFVFLGLMSSQTVNPFLLATGAIMLMFWGYSHQFSLLMFDTYRWLLVSVGLWWLGLWTLFRLGRQRRRA